MSYKLKPHKASAKRFKVTGTGKIKRRCGFTSHLRSTRNGSMQRRLGRPQIMFEGHARNIRYFLGVHAIKPNQIRHQRELARELAAAETQTA
jgi:large subunit ribosomal protein L35